MWQLKGASRKVCQEYPQRFHSSMWTLPVSGACLPLRSVLSSEQTVIQGSWGSWPTRPKGILAMPRLAHSGLTLSPAKESATQRLCLPLTRHRNDNPAFPCKIPSSQFLHLFWNTQNKKQDGAGLAGTPTWSCGGRGTPELPLLKAHSRTGQMWKVQSWCPRLPAQPTMEGRLPHTGSHGVHPNPCNGGTPIPITRECLQGQRTRRPNTRTHATSRALNTGLPSPGPKPFMTGLPLKKECGEGGAGVARSADEDSLIHSLMPPSQRSL